MPLFSRSLKPGPDEALPAMDGAGEMESASRHTIGELLRDTRKSYGGDIDRIATTLRIRAAYLAAIEDGQYDKLPGPVYAQGFVRAYAVHLGLDGDEAVRRFKHEIEGFEVSRDLSFPVPLAARSIPGGTMLLAALILAICGYGLWYYVSTGDRAHPERVSAVPSDFVKAGQKPGNATASSPPAASSPAAAPSAPAAATPAATDDSTPASTPPASTPATAPSQASSTPAPNTTASSASPPPSDAAPAAPANAPASTTTTETPEVATAPATTAPAASPAATGTTPAPGASQPRVFGAPADTPARIVIHAVQDSWVQVRAGDQVITERLLHPGDSVRISDRTGQTLRTGNGAGIELEVDGKLGKPLSGRVRTIALNPDRLTDGVVPPSQIISGPAAAPSPAAAPEPPAPNQ